ncbi:MAG: site-specific DNA-methyltransferase [Methanomicrobiales archaeon]|nr:site-specific DNA-methyltransferase [Methanomicrobiales archaeon]
MKAQDMKWMLNRIVRIDCIEGLRSLPAASVDVIVTSPPYNIGVKYRTYDDRKAPEEYIAWMREIASECRRVMKEDASFFLNIGGTLSNPWFPMEIALRSFRDQLQLQNLIHWIKSIAIPMEYMKSQYLEIRRDLMIGHYKPVNSERYHHDAHEFIFHFTKYGDVKLKKLNIGVPYQDKSNVGRWKSAKSDLRDRGNVWFIPYDTIQTKREHPAVFPVRLAEMCILDHGKGGSDGGMTGLLVLDPFMGIGSTAVACINLDVNFIGFEIDETYIRIANERIDEALKEKGQNTQRSYPSSFIG